MPVSESHSVNVHRLSPALGAVIEGVRLRADMADDEIASIAELLDEHLVLFFEDQLLTPREQRDFARRFGPLYMHPFYAGEGEAPEVMVLEHDAEHRAHADRWHSDVTYLATPPAGSVLYSDEIPSTGGDTMWSSMYAAYDALSAPLRALVDGLRAVHSFAKNFTPQRFSELGMEGRRDELYARNPPVSHPVARTNPATGRKGLFVNADFTTHIEGVSARESDAILRFLYDHNAQPEFAVRWRWKPNTVAFWDNRWTQHCALADYYPHRRKVRRATVIGERPI